MPVCPVHIVVIADNVSTMHVHRCAYNSCNTVQCVHMPMSISESWFTFNHARIFSDLSIRLRLPTVSIPQTKTIFPQMLAMMEQKADLEQSTLELSKCLTVLTDARIRWHCHQTNVCGCQRCTDWCGFGSVWSPVMRKLHGLGRPIHIAYTLLVFRKFDAYTSTKYEFKSCFKHAQHFLQLIMIKLLGNGEGRGSVRKTWCWST